MNLNLRDDLLWYRNRRDELLLYIAYFMQHGQLTIIELISAEKYFTRAIKRVYNTEFMFLPHILLIMSRKPCHMPYALYWLNGEFRL